PRPDGLEGAAARLSSFALSGGQRVVPQTLRVFRRTAPRPIPRPARPSHTRDSTVVATQAATDTLVATREEDLAQTRRGEVGGAVRRGSGGAGWPGDERANRRLGTATVRTERRAGSSPRRAEPRADRARGGAARRLRLSAGGCRTARGPSVPSRGRRAPRGERHHDDVGGPVRRRDRRGPRGRA